MANIKKEIVVRNPLEELTLRGMLHRAGYDLGLLPRTTKGVRYFLLWSDSTVTCGNTAFNECGLSELQAPDFKQITFSNYKNDNNG